ncbi:hypothetical protein P280DRAFT_367824, partial [Massarina eburnea CBS 473.64]
IYSKASRVQICINDPLEGYSKLFQRLKGDQQAIPYQENDSGNDDNGDNSYGTGDSSKGLKIPRSNLFSLRWFKRVWVIQEVALARSTLLNV